MKYKNIYVAASSQHVGKTTSTLGLVANFSKRGLKVGYCKPVGQKHIDVNHLKVDKDAVLFADLIKFDIDPKVHSPVILGQGSTSAYLDHPEAYDLETRITGAAEALSEKHDLIIFEGTGHPGVGSVADLSNARVAKMLNAGVILIVEGGIGSTIDMMNLSLSLFREEGVEVIGVIINKVRKDKMDKVERYVSKWMEKESLNLLGLLPYDQTLAYPLMSTIAGAINGVVTHNEENIDNRIEDILAGSLIELKELKNLQGLLLVAAARNIDKSIKKIISITELVNIPYCPIAGIVATGAGQIEGESLEYVMKHKIPLVRTNLDTYGSVIKISRIEVKINRSTPWKVQRAIELIERNIVLDGILNKVTN